MTPIARALNDGVRAGYDVKKFGMEYFALYGTHARNDESEIDSEIVTNAHRIATTVMLPELSKMYSNHGLTLEVKRDYANGEVEFNIYVFA